ncbi:MAG TPA: GNAT family N-acetyltransferase [Candidatus Diapherotrites archaeon]|nr:GNAT family N-acetyltransferase [Candidatus Diapherotrites archaeon]
MNKNEKITYKKITYKNRHELTPELLKEIYIHNPFKNNANKNHEQYDRIRFAQFEREQYAKIESKILSYSIYLVYVNNEFAGMADGYIEDDEFYVSHLFVKDKFQKQGLAYKLKTYLIADIRKNYKQINKIRSWSLKEMQKINEKIAGERPLPDGTYRTQKSERVAYTISSTKLDSSTKEQKIIIKRKNRPK